MKKILIIEDEKKISRYLQLELEHEGYSVDIASDGIMALKLFGENFYNIILLDLMLPKLSGEEVCRRIRKKSDVPVIVLTATDKTFSKINLLDLGADDYITKPFIIGELLARIRVALRHNKEFSDKGQVISYEGIRLDLNKKLVIVQEEEISLTKTEFNLLHYLILNREIVLSREKILNNIWGYDYNGGEKIVDVYIKSLRKKVDFREKKLIHTVRGFGYMLKKES
ncbi:response regulator transcription factor [Ilyobacter polytropus]|uniref:Two component transcriptional regulator, winged helix family n=1 Tax=Ilyobacter polytropus (strain ATCC 51220 / DSM 2926 / LMG 16218 / CuHBu1) TaxID=572544 RepID=E3HDL4_ILYPC|nr:response regulator transcription factor [Ilyobacter polytropus]ADO84200.1 two component transcriptional regulator, winged helix family [Ilyobacter polytropus DSM 2926]